MRTFDDELVGEAPEGCSIRGEVTVAEAAFASEDSSNQAMRLYDDFTDQTAEATCHYAASSQRSVDFRWTHDGFGSSFLFGLMGETGAGETTHAWWFNFQPVPGTDDLRVRVYDGSEWRRLGHVRDAAASETFVPVAVSATTDQAEVRVGGQKFFTDLPRNEVEALTDVVFSSAGVAPDGMDFYVDDVLVQATADAVDPRTVIAVEPEGVAPRFPDILRLSDDHLLVSYYSAADHRDRAGLIKVTQSFDNGETWSEPWVAVDSEFDDRDPKLTLLDDGTILMMYFVTNWIDPDAGDRTQLGVHLVRSEDDGQTWSDPNWVGTQLTCENPPPADGCPLDSGISVSHGSIIQLDDGDILAPIYGRTPDDVHSRATVARSSDRGVTWDPADEVTIAEGETFAFQEPNLTLMPSGEIIAGLRVNEEPVHLYLSRSDDDGRTWSEPERTDIPASSHHQLLREDGSLLLTYGDVGAHVQNRPTSGILIPDALGDWNGHTPVMVYDSGHTDQANPSSIEVEPGVFMTLAYDVTVRTLYGIRTTVEDYAPAEGDNGDEGGQDDPLEAAVVLTDALEEYKNSGAVDGPIAHQLTNALDLAQRHLDGGRTTPAVQALNRFIRHLDNPKRPDTLADEAREDLRSQAVTILGLL
ncbi:sialidase family protein [Pseudactinotalea sp. Z1748]|uniref:sialidase family protein n=1 Tax=Pseudactinotalea sp. Z1748 TaxID=3413027 RepID=UPI003C79FF55